MIVEERISQKERVNKFAKDLHLSLLREGKSIYVNAWGMSMYPFIKNGDRIKIEPINKEEIKIGDIVAVNIKNEEGPWFFVHRVVKIIMNNGNRIYFTKGDAHKKRLDNPVTIELIAGKITQIQRKDLEINLELSLWRNVNHVIAKLSFRYPKLLHFLSGYISLIVEWKLFLFKLRNRLKKWNPLVYNTEELLLLCARRDLNEELKKKAQGLIKEGVRWEDFCESAMRGGVTILVYNALRRLAPYSYIPPSVLDRLKSGYLFIASEIASQHKESIEVLESFAKKAIPVIPLKGTLLSKRLYGDIATRGLSADFDLLIKENDIEKAEILLKGIDYRLGATEEIKQWQWLNVFYKPEKEMIELHWDITMMVRSKERINGLWQGTELVDYEGVKYYDFEPEELLLYLSAHLVNSDSFRQLRYICDINCLLEKYGDEIDWPCLIQRAKKWRLCGSLYTTLKLSRDLFGLKFPEGTLSKLGVSFPKRIFICAFANKKVILRHGLRRRLLDKFLSYIFLELVEAISFQDYFAIFKRVFFPPKEIVGNKSYITRIFKGIAKFFRRPFVKTIRKKYLTFTSYTYII